MNIKTAIVKLQLMFPKQSVNIGLDLWSHMYQGKRVMELKPEWTLHVASEATLPSVRFASEGATLATLIDMARQHVARQSEDKETLDGARESIKGL